MDLLEVAAVDVQAPDVGSGRDQRLPEADLLLGRELGRAGVEVERGDAGAGHQLDVLLGPPLAGTEQRLLVALLAAQVALGAVGTVVGRVELAANQQDLAPGALLAQPARAVGRGQSPADEQEVDLTIAHGTPPYSPGG